MPRKNPAYLDRNHPVRALLEDAAFGREPTRAQLDELDRTDLPDGHSLARFRSDIAKAAAEIARTHSPAPGVANHLDARRLADNHVARLARQMTDHEAGATGQNPDHIEDLDAVAARMFNK